LSGLETKIKSSTLNSNSHLKHFAMKNITTRQEFLRTLSLLCAAPLLSSNADYFNQKSLPKIGFLSGAGVLHLEKVFMDELKLLGLNEGENIHVEIRLARPNTGELVLMAEELAKMDLALIVVASLPIALEVRKRNPKMPMILCTCPGMVSNGFAETLEHPGGIYTGMDELPPGVTATRLQLLKAAVPGATRIALMSATPGKGGHEVQLADAEKTAASLGIEVKPYRVSSLPELEKALASVIADGMQGMVVFQGALTLANREMVVDFALRNKLPVIYQQAAFVELDDLMSWAPDLEQQFKEAAHYVAKILKGAKPGDLAVKHPDKYYLTLNSKTAETIGVKFSGDLLKKATTIIK
jgi:putative tryptophan/tyrosine transport system substrate-binding protein